MVRVPEEGPGSLRTPSPLYSSVPRWVRVVPGDLRTVVSWVLGIPANSIVPLDQPLYNLVLTSDTSPVSLITPLQTLPRVGLYGYGLPNGTMGSSESKIPLTVWTCLVP